MIRPRARAVALCCTLLFFGRATAGEQAAPEPGVRIERIDGWERLDAVLPGALLGYALPRVEGGSRQIVVLVRPTLEDPSAAADVA